MILTARTTTRMPGLDYGILGAVCALLGIGLLVIYSASHQTAGVGLLLRQAGGIIIGLLGMWLLIRVDYRSWSRYWRLCFFATALVLLATLLIAHPINGARSWVGVGALRVQPSEFAKFAIILALAGLLARFGPRLQHPAFFVRSLLWVAVPILLVLAQPDFGTAMVLCAIWLVMVTVAGARWWMIAAVCLGAALLFTVAWCLPMPNGKTLLKAYQKQRLDFIHADPAGNGYHQRQARIAIGAGGFFGRGYLHGTQTQRGFLPEQSTDFIFAVVGEEFGFLGCAVVLGLYLFILFRLFRIVEEAESAFGRLVVAGVTAMFAVHVLINIGMCLSLSPVTGIPLPLVSYGGSNVLTNLLGLGAALNISRYRQAQRSWAPTEDLVRL